MVFLVILSLAGTTHGAPPAITYLHPAGGQRGTTVEVTAGGTFERWPVQVWTSDKAISATAAKVKGKLSITIAPDAVPGVCWLRLHDEQGASTLRPFIVGTLPDLIEKEPNDEPAKAQAVAGSAVVNGRLEKPGDVDVFAFPLRKGETLVASADADRSLGSPMDAVVQVLSAGGFVLAENNDWHDLDPQLAFAAPKDGAYLVRVFAFPAVPDASIRLSGAETFVYRLTLTTGGFGDYAAPLAVGRSPSPRVTVQGWNIPPEAQTLPVTGAGEVFHPQLANTLRVRLEDHPCWDTLRPTADRRAEPYHPPFSLTSRLESPGGVGTVTVTAKKGQPLGLRAESREHGLAVNPVIRVLDSAGKQLARAEPARINQDVELTFNPPADGAYKVEVRDLHGDGGPRSVYRLRVTPPEPDFDLTVANDRFALDPGKPLDLAVTVTRRGGFAKEIEFAAEGLPAGVSAAVVPPQGKADGRAVTLRLTTDKRGPSGAFRVVGKAKGEPNMVRVARGPVPEFETTTADLWLAVGGQVPPPPPKKKR